MLPNYQLKHFYDEMMVDTETPRTHYQLLYQQLNSFH